MRNVERPVAKERGNLNRIAVVTGISASGKDYLLGKLQIESNHAGVVNFGDELFRYVISSHPEIHSRDDMKNLLSQEEVRNSALMLASNIIQHQPFALNTHVVYSQQGALSVNPDIEAKLKPMEYIFIWANPSEIEFRRRKDSSRRRSAETIDQIRLHQEIALEVVTALAKDMGSELLIIHNRVDNVSENVEKLRQALDKLGTT